MPIVNWFVGFLLVCAVVGVALVGRHMALHPYTGDGRIVDVMKPARNAIIATWVWLATDIALILAAIGTINVLGGMGGPIGSVEALKSADAFSSVTGIAYSIAFAVAGYMILRWVYLTNRNAQALNPAMTVTPGWAVFWFFIPIANLWKPFDGVRQTWQASADPQAPDAVPIPMVMRMWWGLWIIASIMGNIGSRMSLSAETPQALIAANRITVATLPVDIALAIALTTMMRRLSQIQRDAAGGMAQARPGSAADAVFD